MLFDIAILIGAALPSAASVVSWTGAVNGLWSNGGNWTGGVAPVAGDQLVFPDGALNTNNANDLPAGTVFSSLSITGGSYQIGGNLIGLSAGINIPPNGAVIFNAPFQLAATQTFSFRFLATFNGSIDLNGSNLTINGYGTVVNGAISGTGNVTLAVSDVTLNGNNTYTGTTTVQTFVAINGSQPQSDVIVDGNDATLVAALYGTGTVGNLIVMRNATLMPGTSGALSNGTTLFKTKNLILSPTTSTTTSFLRMDLAGSAPGSGYDQIKVTGTVNIGANATLHVLLTDTFTALVGQQFILIDNDGTDPVNGTFGNYLAGTQPVAVNGAPEGTIITIGAYQFRLSYAGGDGNDVTLTNVAPTATTPPIPALDAFGLLALVITLAAIAVLTLKR